MDVWKRHVSLQETDCCLRRRRFHAADGRNTALRPKAFAVLEYLSEHRNRIESPRNTDARGLVHAGWLIREAVPFARPLPARPSRMAETG